MKNRDFVSVFLLEMYIASFFVSARIDCTTYYVEHMLILIFFLAWESIELRVI